MRASSKALGYVLLFLLVVSVRAQTTSGGLRGLVQDSGNARIASARIVVQRMGGSQARETISDGRGEFHLDDLAAGEWQVTVTAPGFAVVGAEETISVSSIRDITVTLQPASVRQSVGVVERGGSIATQQIDLAGNVHQSIVTSQDLETLPLPARSFANIAYLAPGTEPVEPSDPTKARITAVSTGGSSGLNNELSVDGGDNSDDFIGGFLQNYSPDSIQEFAIRTSQEDADTGGTTAGSIVITTKRGGDGTHGSAAFYERASGLNARFPIENPAPNPKQPFSRQNYVGTIGGALVQDKLWYFGAIEAVHEDASIAYSDASSTQFDALAKLASEGLIPGVTSIPVPGNVTVPFRDYFDSLRFDWAQTPRSQWFLRASTDSYTTHNSLVQQGTLPSTGLLTHNNYFSMVVSNQFAFTPRLLGTLVLEGSGLHLTQTRNSNLGFALAFPFSSTSLTVSGFETFGDNQFATPITFFPSERNQEKYQIRYDLTHARGAHTLKGGVNLIHEPVLGGKFPSNTETLYQFPQDPVYYLNDRADFTSVIASGGAQTNLGGGFSQNVQRLAFYGEDSWRVTRSLTLNYGLRYQSTYGLFLGSGRSQAMNPGAITLAALGIPLVPHAAGDDHVQIQPRVGFAWAPLGKGLPGSGRTVIRGGFGMYYNDLAQTGWAPALQAVQSAPGPCVDPVKNPAGAENAGCVGGDASGGTANIIGSGYRTPYAIHFSGGIQHAFNDSWQLSADYIHEQGNHAYRAYSYTGGTNLFTPQLSPSDPNQATYVPDVNLFRSDNRSSFNGLMIHLQGKVSRRLDIVGNYTFSKAQTWGCVLGELFDYVNGVCNPLNAFGPGDYGPSGEDVRQRAVVAASWRLPAGFEWSGISQAESARPFTVTTADNSGRIEINGVPTVLDQFRGTPYIQTDMRVTRPIHLGDTWTVAPFAECFNLLNRNNSGANYVTNIAVLPVPVEEANPAPGHPTNITDVCSNGAASCSLAVAGSYEPIKSPDQLRLAGGALGDFFGPGTTVGIPFAAQLGVHLTF